jgi:hypothetical protein
LHEGTNFSQYIHKKISETLFFQHFWQNAFSVAVLINPNIMQNLILYGIYAARLLSKHSLALSILLDNYGLLHLVNDKHLLMPGSFRPAYDKYVEAKPILFPVKGHGTRIIKDVIKNLDGSTFNFILHNVAVVDNFHCNIVLENRLARAEIWFCGFNATFRTKTIKKPDNMPAKKTAQPMLFIIHPEFFLFFGCFYTYASECRPRYGGGLD